MQSRKLHAHFRMFPRPFPNFLNHPPRRTPAVISEAEEAPDILQILLRRALEVRIEARRNFMPLAAVPTRLRSIREHARSARAFPPKRGLFDGHDIFRRPSERETFDPRGRQNFWQTF